MKQKEFLKWCLNQNKGISLIKVNEILSKVYIAKSYSALKISELAKENGELEWTAIAAYYARYNIFYALLMKCGIKCEIHDCSISLMKYFFVDTKILDEKFYEEICTAKDLRIKTQYYVSDDLTHDEILYSAKNIRTFIFAIEEIMQTISQDMIRSIRQEINNLK